MFPLYVSEKYSGESDGMVLKKKKRILSGILAAAVLMSAIPMSVYAETGQILSEDDQDAKSIDGWVGEGIDERSGLFDTIGNPNKSWYQYNLQNYAGISSPMDSDSSENIIEYCSYYLGGDNSKGTIYKDHIINSPGYYNLSASCQIYQQLHTDIGKLKIEVYDNTSGTGAPIGSSSVTAQNSVGEWAAVSIPGLYVTSKAKMIRVVLEASTANDENDYVDFDGLSVTLVAAAAPPVISNLDKDTVTFTEGGSEVSLDKDSNVTVKVDYDFGRTYNGGSVTAAITGNGVATEDVLELAETGGITLSESDVLYNGTSIGTYSAAGAGMNLSVLLNPNADDTSVAALIKAIVYRNTNAVKPDTKPRTVKVSAEDNTYNPYSVYTTVNVQSVNYAPVRKSGVEASASDSVSVKTQFSLDLSTIFEDPDTDTLTYKVKVNDGAELTANEQYTYTPTAAGTDTLVFTANDGTVDSTDTYTVTLTAVNTAPARKSEVQASDSMNMILGTAYNLDLSTVFEDADNDTLSYTVKINEEEEKNAAGGYTYTPPATGTYTLVFKANDGTDNSSDTYTVTLNVKAANIIPARAAGVSETGTGTVAVQKTYSVNLAEIFEDANDDALTYTVKVNGAAEETAPAIYSYKPTAADTYTLVFRANDGLADSTDTYTVTLTAVNTVPERKTGIEAAESDTITVSTSYQLDLSTIFEDENGDALTYKVKVNEEAEDTASSDYSFTPTETGTYTLVFKANDGSADSTDIYTVTLEVKAANTAPARAAGISETGADSVAVQKTYSVNLDEIFVDADGDPLTYTVKVNSGAEETADASYSYKPTAAGTYTLVFRANDGTAYSTDLYTVTLTAVNTVPLRKTGVEDTDSETIIINHAYSLDLSTIFEDENKDALSYKVKTDGEAEVGAEEQYYFTPTEAGTHTLVFKANDGIADSTDTYTVTLTATENPVRSVTSPASVTGITNGSAKTSSGLGLPETVTLETDMGDISADVTWNVSGSSYDPDQKEEQMFDVEGTVVLPDGVYNPDGISLDVTVNVTVKAKVLVNKVLESIDQLTAITGSANGTPKTASALGLPENVSLETDDGTVSADVTWNVSGSSYDPDQKTEQIFTVEGTVTLPDGVVNPDNVSLEVTIEVTVDAETPSDKVMVRLVPLNAITGVINGTAKTVSALGIPSGITMVTDAGNVKADVIWDLDSSSYDPDSSEEQSFTVEGTVILPDDVTNPNGISLEVSIDVTVLEEAIEQEYYTLRIRVTKRPEKVSYTLGEDLDTQGLEVTEYQKASPSEAVRKTVLSEDQYDLEYNLARTGTRTVKVIYYATDRYGNEKEFTDDFTVTVKDLPKGDSDDDDRDITGPGKQTGGDDDHYYPGNWQSDETGWKITAKDGSRPVNRWVYTDWKGKNDWYFFDENGYMVTGWFEYKGSVYYLNPVSDGKKGYMYTGWNMVDGKWYYFSEAADAAKGSMLKDTVTPDGHQVGPEGERIS